MAERNGEQESAPNSQIRRGHRQVFSLDTWAVLLALGAAALVRLGVLTHVKW